MNPFDFKNVVIRRAQVSWIMGVLYHEDREGHEGNKMNIVYFTS